jgi:hypothetical protein
VAAPNAQAGLPVVVDDQSLLAGLAPRAQQIQWDKVAVYRATLRPAPCVWLSPACYEVVVQVGRP